MGFTFSKMGLTVGRSNVNGEEITSGGRPVRPVGIALQDI
jgi:hypothetical protein